MIEINKSMLQLMYELITAQGEKLPSRLKEIIDEGIVEEDGCWFLAKYRRRTSQYKDRTGRECDVNKIHIDEKNSVDPVKLQQQGFLYVEALRQILEPRGTFKIILDLSYMDAAPHYLTCNVRFHKVRPEESWLGKDWEGSQMNALLVLTTDQKQHRMLTFDELVAKKSLH